LDFDRLIAAKDLTPKQAAGFSFWAQPLAEALRQDAKEHMRPLIVALAGPPCSSKALFADFLAKALGDSGCPALHVRVRDFRLSKHARERLCETVHPLFAYPGQLGTHDTGELERVLLALRANSLTQPLHIPSFDRAYDVRHAFSKWTVVNTLPRVVLVSGWTLGAVAQEDVALNQPVNDLERERDPDQKWRRATNNMARDHYQPLYGLFDRWVYSKPPSWDAVCQWNQRDHEVWIKRMSDRGVQLSDEQRQGGEIFSQLSQRFALESVARLSRKSDYVLTLDADRRITSFARTRND